VEQPVRAVRAGEDASGHDQRDQRGGAQDAWHARGQRKAAGERRAAFGVDASGVGGAAETRHREVGQADEGAEDYAGGLSLRHRSRALAGR